jgi:hypothetical protein
MKLGKYYLLGVILPSAISALSLITFSTVMFWDYKNSRVNGQTVVFASVVGSLVMSLICCFASLPILLNQFKVVFNNIFLSFITWFFFPSLYFSSLFITFADGTIRHGKSTMEFLLMLTLPNIFGLIMSFIIFRRRLSSQLTERDQHANSSIHS